MQEVFLYSCNILAMFRLPQCVKRPVATALIFYFRLYHLHQYPARQQHAAVGRYIQRQPAMVGMIINASGIIALFIRQHYPGDDILIGDAKLPHRHSDASAITTVVDDDCALVCPAHTAVGDELAVCQKLF